VQIVDPNGQLQAAARHRRALPPCAENWNRQESLSTTVADAEGGGLSGAKKKKGRFLNKGGGASGYARKGDYKTVRMTQHWHWRSSGRNGPALCKVSTWSVIRATDTECSPDSPNRL